MQKLILSALAVCAFNAHAGNDGGGGGIICPNPNKCMTLAEAGLRIKKNDINSNTPQKPAVPIEVIKELDRIIEALLKLSLGRVVWDKLKEMTDVPVTTFERVEYYDVRKFEKIKEEYYQILKENDFSASNLSIAAVSNSNKTYLLPDFFMLNLRSQALILIHEAAVRVSGSVKKALELDGYIVDALNGSKNIFNLTQAILNINPGHLLYAKYYLSNFITDQGLNSGKKYKLSPEFINKLMQDRGISFQEDLYISNDLYNQYPDLWNVINAAGIKNLSVNSLYTKVTPSELQRESTFMSKKTDSEVLKLYGYVDSDDLEYCKNAEDGIYMSGSIQDNNAVFRYYYPYSDISLIECAQNKISSVTGMNINRY